MGIFKLNGIDYMGGGGGGNTNYEELTQLEYDALTEEEKNNGTIYFITDANSNQDGKFQPVIYSESEREIGVWTDGKPLYQKTVIFVGGTNGTINIPHGISNIDTLVDIQGTCSDTYGNGDIRYPISRLSSDNNHIYFQQIDATNITYNVPTVFSNRIINVQFTVRYTKTTDSPGSGQWTPQGVPAVHYDGNEKVVGTWFGETLYEKTIYIGTLTKDSSWHNITHNISNINNVVSCVGSFRNTVDNMHFNLPMHRPGQQNGILIGCDSDYVKYTNTWIDTAVDGYATIRYTKQSPSQGGN